MRPGMLVLGLLLGAACAGGPQARSERSFDEIVAQVAEMNAAEVAATLGQPDSRQPVYLRDERWTWWNFTFLAGENYPPEVRGQVVHLAITFRNPTDPGGAPRPYTEWRIAQPFGIGYLTPGSGRAHVAGELAPTNEGG